MTMAGIEGIHRRRHGKKRPRLAAGAVVPDLLNIPGSATSAPPPTNTTSRHRSRCLPDGGHFSCA